MHDDFAPARGILNAVLFSALLVLTAVFLLLCSGCAEWRIIPGNPPGRTTAQLVQGMYLLPGSQLQELDDDLELVRAA